MTSDSAHVWRDLTLPVEYSPMTCELNAFHFYFYFDPLVALLPSISWFRIGWNVVSIE